MAEAWTDAVRLITAKLEIQWDGSTWVDESAYLIAAQGDASIQQIWQLMGGTGSGQPATATFTMSWANGRYSPFNTSSGIYNDIKDTQGYGAGVRFSLRLGSGSYVRAFTGVIDALQITGVKSARVSIRAVDYSAALSQHRISTALTQNTTAGNYIATLAWLAGITDTDIDAGLYALPWAWLDDEGVWAEMCLLAQAEGGLVRFDRNGTLFFANAEAWVDAAPAHTFTVSRFSDLAFSGSWQNVYNRVVVVYADRVPVAADTMFSLREGLVIAPGETYNFTAQHKPAYTALTYTATITNAQGDDLSNDVAVNTTGYAARTEIAITNNSLTTAAMVSVLALEGQALSGDDDHDVAMDVMGGIVGEVKAFRCTGNPYLQTRAQAAFLAELLRDRLKTARATYTITGPGIPTLEPGNLVEIVESTSGVNCAGFVQGVTWSFSGGVYNATYRVIDATDWYLYDGYFEIGSSLLGGSDVLFY